jgi:hypothetical protein
MRKWLHEKCSAVFFLTLIIYLITLFTVQDVGVYLTYVAIPVIVISGSVAYITRPTDASET